MKSSLRVRIPLESSAGINRLSSGSSYDLKPRSIKSWDTKLHAKCLIWKISPHCFCYIHRCVVQLISSFDRHLYLVMAFASSYHHIGFVKWRANEPISRLAWELTVIVSYWSVCTVFRGARQYSLQSAQCPYCRMIFLVIKKMSYHL